MKRNCVDCFYFKMKRKWKHAYCDLGILIHEHENKPRLFNWTNSLGQTLLKRGRKMKFLQGCSDFESMVD